MAPDALAWSASAPPGVDATLSLASPFQYSLPATSLTAQSRPSSSPAPVMAEHARMLHLCVPMLLSSRLWRQLAARNSPLAAPSSLLSLHSILDRADPQRIRTSRICSSVNDPMRSCLFAKTSNVAPASRFRQQPASALRGPSSKRTSSRSSPRSSSRQSLIRMASLESTTHTTASVDSK